MAWWGAPFSDMKYEQGISFHSVYLQQLKAPSVVSVCCFIPLSVGVTSAKFSWHQKKKKWRGRALQLTYSRVPVCCVKWGVSLHSNHRSLQCDQCVISSPRPFSDSSDKLDKFWTLNGCREEKTATKQVQLMQEHLFNLCVMYCMSLVTLLGFQPLLKIIKKTKTGGLLLTDERS